MKHVAAVMNSFEFVQRIVNSLDNLGFLKTVRGIRVFHINALMEARAFNTLQLTTLMVCGGLIWTGVNLAMHALYWQGLLAAVSGVLLYGINGARRLELARSINHAIMGYNKTALHEEELSRLIDGIIDTFIVDEGLDPKEIKKEIYKKREDVVQKLSDEFMSIYNEGQEKDGNTE